jgi:hypothetical protein
MGLMTQSCADFSHESRSSLRLSGRWSRAYAEPTGLTECARELMSVVSLGGRAPVLQFGVAIVRDLVQDWSDGRRIPSESCR